MSSMYMKVLNNKHNKIIATKRNIDCSTVRGRKDKEIVQEELSFVEQLMELEERRIQKRLNFGKKLKTVNN